ncbi:DUF2189 domain-containing protein [Shimia sp.]|uniref:DUF2189 domain-containing protein n=1 Tax=Shimia sp. TaxID=1954381 RepID=UPI003569358A
MTAGTETPKPPEPASPEPAPPAGPRVNRVSAADIAAALRAGVADFRARPLMSGFFGLFYAAFGLIFLWILLWLGKVWMIVPVAVGFPLIAPFAAAGLYEMSRRMQQGESFGWSEILGVMARQRQREMGWMAFVTLFVFWVWVYQFRTVLVITLQDSSFSDLDGFVTAVFFTPAGWTFLAIGTCVGAFLSTVLFSVTVIAMPMLLDRDTDFVTAMLTSVRSVTESPRVMLAWAAIIAATLLLSMALAFLGLIVTLPVLGHATWHLYQRAVPPAQG